MKRPTRLCAWFLWVGTAAALQSAEHGNMGPFGSWEKRGTFDNEQACTEGRTKAVAEYVGANPTAIMRRDDLVVDKKPLAGDEATIVHSAIRYICLPDDAKPPDFVDPSKPPAATPPQS